MSSVQCNKCSCRIQYHGIPNGIEFVLIKDSDWQIIQNSSFDPQKKQYHRNTGYPLLYRSDTIESDFIGCVRKIWKCPVCGSLLFFDKGGTVCSAYAPSIENITADPDINNGDSKYIVFSDYEWNDLTEAAVPDQKINAQFHSIGKLTVLSGGASALFSRSDGKNIIYYIIDV